MRSINNNKMASSKQTTDYTTTTTATPGGGTHKRWHYAEEEQTKCDDCGDLWHYCGECALKSKLTLAQAEDRVLQDERAREDEQPFWNNIAKALARPSCEDVTVCALCADTTTTADWAGSEVCDKCFKVCEECCGSKNPAVERFGDLCECEEEEKRDIVGCCVA